MLYGFVYITTNNINGKKYIGKKKIDKKDAKTYLGSGKKLRNAIKKYGSNNFSRDIIDYAVSESHLNILEKHYISLYNAQESDDFYNISSGGDWGDITKGMSDEEKRWYGEKISTGLKKAYKNNPELRTRASERMKKVSFSEEHLEKLRLARESSKGRKVSDEQKRKLKRIMDIKYAFGIKPKNPWLYKKHPWIGREHSEETKQKISNSLKGLSFDVDDPRYGKSIFAGSGNPMYGKSHTEETKQKISEKSKMFWENNELSEQLREAYRKKFSVEYLGSGNPNFGNKWTEEQKKSLSEKVKNSGRYKGNKNPMYGKNGKNAINGQKVYMLNDDGDVVKIFASVKEAQKFLNVKAHSGLNKACREKTKYHNYYWKKEFRKRSNDYSERK